MKVTFSLLIARRTFAACRGTVTVLFVVSSGSTFLSFSPLCWEASDEVEGERSLLSLETAIIWLLLWGLLKEEAAKYAQVLSNKINSVK
jgi:hypothetical protein